MPYVKLDDMFWDNEKVHAAGWDGAGLYAACLSLSGHFLTDGYVSDRRLKQIGAPKRVIDKVTAAGLWRRKGDGYQIPDYTQLNYSKAEVSAYRKKEAERKRIARMLKAGLSDPESDPPSGVDVQADGAPESDPESGDPKPYLPLPNAAGQSSTSLKRFQRAVSGLPFEHQVELNQILRNSSDADPGSALVLVGLVGSVPYAKLADIRARAKGRPIGWVVEALRGEAA